MKTKIAIVDITSFVLGMVLFFIAFAELFLFIITHDVDKISILCLAVSLGLRHMQDSTVRLNFKVKEEDNDRK